MKRLIKWTSLFIIVLVALLAAVPFFIPLDSVKKIATDKVKEATGRDLIIAGDIKASMWPDIGVTLQQVSLSNPQGYSAKNIAEIGDVTVEVALMPLLSGEIRINEFIIDKPIINLEVDKKGIANWEFSPQKKENKDVATPENPEPAKPATALTTLGGIKITNGDFTYKDQRTGKSYNASKVDLDVKMQLPESTLDVVANMDYNKEAVNATFHIEEPVKLLGEGESKVKANVKVGALFALVFDGKASKKNANGNVDLSSSSLVALSDLTGKKMDWKGDTALAFSAGAAASCTTELCSFSKAKVTLDDSTFNGDAKINFAGAVPSVEAKLAADKFDLNHYLPKAEKQAFISLVSEAQAAPQGWDTKPIDFSGLKSANIKLALEVAELLYQETTLSKLSLNAQLAGGALVLNIPHVEFYSGTAKIAATANSGGAVSANLVINNVQIEPMLKDFAEFDRLSGIANISTSITGNGTSQQAIISSLNGKGDIKINDGTIRGVNIAEIVSNAKAMVTGADTSGDKTKFSELGGTYTITQGIVKNEDLVMKAPLLRLTGSGTVDLPNRYVNYRLLPSVVATLQGQGGKDKTGIEIPVMVEGNFEKLKFTPDLASVAKDALENPDKIKDTVKSLKDKEGIKNLKDSLKKPENIENLLKGFR